MQRVTLLVFNLILLCNLYSFCKITKRDKAKEYCNDVGQGVEIGQMDDKDMEEASGVAYSRIQAGVLYTINDHGGANSVIAFGESGDKMTDIILEGIENEDWEDIATTVTDGVSYILVSDTGDNDHERDPLAILRFREPDLSSGDEVTIARADTEVLEVRYDEFNYDCEALGEYIMTTIRKVFHIYKVLINVIFLCFSRR